MGTILFYDEDAFGYNTVNEEDDHPTGQPRLAESINKYG